MSFCSSLRPLDIEFMKRLSKVVNIVPVIAKADTLTLEERVYFKQRVGPASAPPPAPLGGLIRHSRPLPPPLLSRFRLLSEQEGLSPALSSQKATRQSRLGTLKI